MYIEVLSRLAGVAQDTTHITRVALDYNNGGESCQAFFFVHFSPVEQTMNSGMGHRVIIK